MFFVRSTGCDSGLGHDLAKCLDSAGMKVFAGVLDEFSPGALELKRTASSKLTVLQLDITKRRQIKQAYEFIQSQTCETGNNKGTPKIRFAFFLNALNKWSGWSHPKLKLILVAFIQSTNEKIKEIMLVTIVTLHALIMCICFTRTLMQVSGQ